MLTVQMVEINGPRRWRGSPRLELPLSAVYFDWLPHWSLRSGVIQNRLPTQRGHSSSPGCSSIADLRGRSSSPRCTSGCDAVVGDTLPLSIRAPSCHAPSSFLPCFRCAQPACHSDLTRRRAYLEERLCEQCPLRQRHPPSTLIPSSRSCSPLRKSFACRSRPSINTPDSPRTHGLHPLGTG